MQAAISAGATASQATASHREYDPVEAAAIRIRPMRSSEAGEWDEYVLSHPHGSPFHLTAWKRTIEEVFRYRPIYLVARTSEGICGVLPLFFIDHILTGRFLLSVPFAVYGGVLADDEGVRTAFAAAVKRLGRRLRVGYVELRNAWPEQCVGFEQLPRYVTFTQGIGPSEEAILESIPRKTRRMVRKSLERDFTTRPASDCRAFEDLYQKNLLRLGTPAFPSRYFRILLDNFGPMADIREVMTGGQAAAAVLTFCFRDQVMPYYGASDPALHALAPNNYMYFDLMRWGGQNGYAVFDFGRSKKNVGGSYDFKAHWGMTERPLPYEVLLVRRKAMPNFTPANPVFELPRKVWQRLPLAVAKRIGPLLLRALP